MEQGLFFVLESNVATPTKSQANMAILAVLVAKMPIAALTASGPALLLMAVLSVTAFILVVPSPLLAQLDVVIHSESQANTETQYASTVPNAATLVIGVVCLLVVPTLVTALSHQQQAPHAQFLVALTGTDLPVCMVLNVAMMAHGLAAILTALINAAATTPRDLLVASVNLLS
jgi:hypothetical protein